MPLKKQKFCTYTSGKKGRTYEGIAVKRARSKSPRNVVSLDAWDTKKKKKEDSGGSAGRSIEGVHTVETSEFVSSERDEG